MKKLLLSLALALFLMPNVVSAGFSDVPMFHQYFAPILWMQDNGVVEGFTEIIAEEGTLRDVIVNFHPEDKINRAEFLKMLFEMKAVDWDWNETVMTFSDVPYDSWYRDYVKMAFAAGIVEGYEDNTFRPTANINFAEAQKIVMEHFFSFDEEYEHLLYESCSLDLNSVLLNLEFSEDDWFAPYYFLSESRCLLDFGSDAVINMEYEDVNATHEITRGDMAELLYRTKAFYDNDVTKYLLGMTPSRVAAENEFYWENLLIDDVIVGMEVESIESAIGDFMWMYDIGIQFTGETTVTGSYSSCEDCMIPGVVFFEVDEADLHKLPKMLGGIGHGFIILKQDALVDPLVALGPVKTEGTATILIDNYYIFSAETEGGHGATLIEVIESEITGSSEY